MRNWKGAVTKVALVLLALITFAPKAENQGISPLIQVLHANKKGHAEGVFQSINSTAVPMVVTLELKSLSLDVDGHARVSDIDKTKVHIAVDSMSARVPPLASHTFTFTADCDGPCSFLVLTYSGGTQKVENGLSVRMVIAETVYVQQSQPMQKTDVDVSWTDAHTLVLKNTSGKMARFSPNDIHYADKKSVPYPDFTLLPQMTRVLHFPDATPTRVEMHSERFAITTAPAQ